MIGPLDRGARPLTSFEDVPNLPRRLVLLRDISPHDLVTFEFLVRHHRTPRATLLEAPTEAGP